MKTRARAPLGTRRVRASGYVYVKTAEGWRREHDSVMEEVIGRRLRKNEIVHHKNRWEKTNNDLANLQLMTNRAHSRHHGHDRALPDMLEAFDAPHAAYKAGMSVKQILRVFRIDTNTLYKQIAGLKLRKPQRFKRRKY